jgi:hypothetical protein
MFIDTHDERTKTTFELLHAVRNKIMVPALHRRATNGVGLRQTDLGQATLMQMKDLLPKLLSGPLLGQDSGNLEHEVTPAGFAQEFGNPDTQTNQTLTQERVLKLAFSRGFDTVSLTLALWTGRIGWNLS